MVTNSTTELNLRPSRPSGSTGSALEEEEKAEQHIITEAAPIELKLGGGV